MQSRNLLNKQVTLNREEFMDCCKKMVDYHQEWNKLSQVTASEQWSLLVATEKPKYGWFHRYAHRLIVFAIVAVLFLTVKSAAEGFAGNLARENYEQSRNN
jgi:hypothetical protein